MIKSKKILILGASGNLGLPLYKNLKKSFETIGTYKNNKIQGLYKFDIIKDSLVNFIDTHQITDLILCQGIINFNKIAVNPSEANKINVIKLINQLKKVIKSNKKIKITYFSSESIFDGIKGNYTERSKPNPIFLYGKQKLNVERFIIDNFNQYLVFRVAKVYDSDFNKNTLIIDWIKKLLKNEKILLAKDNIFTPIHIEDFLKFVVKSISLNLNGIYNISSNDNFSRHELFEIFFKQFKKRHHTNSYIEKTTLDKILKNFTLPKNTSLTNHKIKLKTGIEPKSFKYYSSLICKKYEQH